MVNKPGWVLTYGQPFSTKTLLVISHFLCLSFLLFFLVGVSDRFENFFSHLFLSTCVTKIKSPLLEKLANCFSYVLKVCGYEHDIPYALKINSNGWFKQGHLASYPSTRNKIISQLRQCLWLPNLDFGAWTYIKGSDPLSHMTLARAHVLARSRDKLKPLHL